MIGDAVKSLDVNATMRRLEALTPVVRSILGNAEAWLESFPLPAWVKSATGEMVFINQSYSDLYNVKREDYIGRRDSAVWGSKPASGFAENDLAVARTKEPQIFKEKLPEDRSVLVLKFPVYDGSKFLGVGGIVISDSRADGIPRIATALAAEHGKESRPA